MEQKFKKFRLRQPINSYLVIFIYRFGNYTYYKVHIPFICQFLWILYRVVDLIILKSLIGCDIPAKCNIGHGLSLRHGANGVVLHPTSVLGNNVTLYHQVTIGLKMSIKDEIRLAPRIGNNVVICAGAKIIGDICVQDNVTIGANAVVLSDVPEGAIAVGVPAIIKNKQRK